MNECTISEETETLLLLLRGLDPFSTHLPLLSCASHRNLWLSLHTLVCYQEELGSLGVSL